MLCGVMVNRSAAYAKHANVTQTIYDVASCHDYKVVDMIH
jgi:hypothetical protein